MTKRVIHLNKDTGTAYVYEYISYWDKEKKQGRNKQVCIGKLDPESGELIPSKRLVSPQPLQQGNTIDPTITAAKPYRSTHDGYDFVLNGLQRSSIQIT